MPAPTVYGRSRLYRGGVAPFQEALQSGTTSLALSLLPGIPQQFCHDVVAPPAVDEHVSLKPANLAVAGRRLGFGAGHVPVDIPRLELAQRKLRERIPCAQLHKLAAKAFSPHRFVADYGPCGGEP